MTNLAPFCAKILQAKSIIDELSTWSWKSPRRVLEDRKTKAQSSNMLEPLLL